MAIQNSQIQNISNALAGFGAGIQGQLPQFLQQQQNAKAQDQQMAMQNEQMGMQRQQFSMAKQRNQQEMDIERQKTMFIDANAALGMAEKGDYDSVIKLGLGRLKLLQNFPGADPSDTQRLTQLAVAAKNGSEEAADLLNKELRSTVEIGKGLGIIQTPKEEGFTLADGAQRFDAKGNLVAGNTKELPAGYELIPTAEAKALGLPETSSYQRNKETGQISGVGGAQTVVNVGQATEGERTAGILANRLDFAQSQINDVLAEAPEAQGPGALPTALSSVGLDYLARISNPAERQIIEAAQQDMLDAALTLGTGAAYTKEQLQGYKKSYFPQLGDDKKTIDAKAKRLTNLLEAAYAKAGRAAPETMRSATTSADAPAPAQVGRFRIIEEP